MSKESNKTIKHPVREDYYWLGSAAAAVAILFTLLFGITGLLSFVGFVLVFLIPSYVILDNFDIDFYENIIFSIFIGLGVFPTIVYGLGFLVGIRLAIIITFSIMLSAGLLVRVFKKSKNQNKAS